MLDSPCLRLISCRVGDGDHLDALPKVLERRHLEWHVGMALELHVEPGNGAVNLDPSFVATLRGLSNSRTKRALQRFAMHRPALRRQGLADVDLPPVWPVPLGFW
jgi:hypothetical protein